MLVVLLHVLIQLFLPYK